MKTCMTFLSLRPYFFFYPATRDISPEKQIYRDFQLNSFWRMPTVFIRLDPAPLPGLTLCLSHIHAGGPRVSECSSSPSCI